MKDNLFWRKDCLYFLYGGDNIFPPPFEKTKTIKINSIMYHKYRLIE